MCVCAHLCVSPLRHVKLNCPELLSSPSGDPIITIPPKTFDRCLWTKKKKKMHTLSNLWVSVCVCVSVCALE